MPDFNDKTPGFDALLGGGRNADDGQYARLEAHGFYWSASEGDPGGATCMVHRFCPEALDGIHTGPEKSPSIA